MIDSEGRQRAFARSVYTPGGLMPADWERAFAAAVGRLFAQRPGERPACVCVSGNGPTLAALDAAGEAVALLPWNGPVSLPPDARDAPSFFLPHVRWFRETAFEADVRTALFLSSQEWLSFRLGAAPAAALPQNAYRRFYWDDEQRRLFGERRDRFPPFVLMGEVTGRVSADAARRFPGIPRGVPVAAGPPDFIAALIGTAVMEPGMVCDRAGTSEGVNLCLAAPPEAAPEGARVLPHAREGFWNAGAVIPESGKLFEDYLARTGQAGRDYDEVLAALTGEGARDGDERTREGRAVLEAMAGAVRDAAARLARFGFPVTEMRVSGGQGKSRRWNQFKANLTGLRLAVPAVRDGELAGDAVLGSLALQGLGHAALAREAERMVRIEEVFVPQGGGKREMDSGLLVTEPRPLLRAPPCNHKIRAYAARPPCARLSSGMD
ncbi:MAG: FGGY-family carbohydrate kinase [Treponematales bacterium]